jgi:fructokinase
MVSRLGCDELGERALEIVQRLGLETRYLQRDREHPTGTVEVSFDEKKNPEYRIIPEVAYDFIEPRQELHHVVRGADCLCFGTLIQRNDVSQNTLYQLLESFSGSFTLLDINLRQDCYSRHSILKSIGHADILKLNAEEAELLADIYEVQRTETGLDLAVFSRVMLERTKLELVVVTLGARGVFAASRQGRRIYHPAFSVELEDPVGSGDAFSAGFLDALLDDRGLVEACRYGNALGALVASQEGATQSLDRPQIDSFLETAELGPVEESLRQHMVH